MSPPQRSVEEIRDSVQEVLSRPEYRPPAKSLVERLREIPLELLERALDALFGGGGGVWLAWTILALGLAAVVLLAVRFAGGVTRDATQTVAVTGRRRATAAQWRQQAEDAERAGRWRAGLRARYRALVAELAEKGLVDEVAGRTAGEYRAEVSRNVPDAATPFSGATELFERAWYGHSEPGEPDATRMRELSDEVLTGADR